jgi:heme-degrading monooxygenase HmoA
MMRTSDDPPAESGAVILRVWCGRAVPDKAEAYRAHLQGNVLPELKALPGFRGVSLLRRDEAGLVELTVMTRWDSMEAIRAFARDTPEKAVVEPEARAVLVDFDETVRHYDIVWEA